MYRIYTGGGEPDLAVQIRGISEPQNWELVIVRLDQDRYMLVRGLWVDSFGNPRYYPWMAEEIIEHDWEWELELTVEVPEGDPDLVTSRARDPPVPETRFVTREAPSRGPFSV